MSTALCIFVNYPVSHIQYQGSMKFHFIFLPLIDGSSFFFLVFFQFSILSTIDNAPREYLIENKARFPLFFAFIINISVISVKAGIISHKTYAAKSRQTFSLLIRYLNLCYYFSCWGNSDNDLSVRYFSSQRAWKIILQSLRLPFNLCTSSEEIHFRDVFSLFLPDSLSTDFFVVRRLFGPQNVCSV